MPSDSVIVSLADPEVKRDREARLDQPHIQPLVNLVEQIRGDLGVGREVPMPDPADGGVNARLLLLLEAPGPKAVRTGCISLDNPDPTARNLREFLAGAGIPRPMVLLWNVVPWFIREKNSRRIRAARGEDLEQGLKYLRLLLRRLPRLEAVVVLGGAAQRAWEQLEWPEFMPRIETYHPSNRALNPDPARRQAVRKALASAASYVYRSDGVMAQTAAEAEAQALVVPSPEAWFPFAHSLDGYGIAEELGIDLGEFAHEQRSSYFRTGQWSGSQVELRLVLFYLARARRFNDGPGVEDRPRDVQAIKDLLEAISAA